MRFPVPNELDVGFQDYVLRLERVEQSSLWLDARFRVPLTRIHFGWDAVWGLIPIAGDLASAAFSIRNMHLAYQLGASSRLLCSMAGNVLVDLSFGAVPIIGTCFDVWYRANLRNLSLLTTAIEAHRRLARADNSRSTLD